MQLFTINYDHFVKTFIAHDGDKFTLPFSLLLRPTNKGEHGFYPVNSQTESITGVKCRELKFLININIFRALCRESRRRILERQYPGKPTLKVAFGNGNGAIFENSSKLRASLFVTSRLPRSSGQTNYQVHHPPLYDTMMFTLKKKLLTQNTVKKELWCQKRE